LKKGQKSAKNAKIGLFGTFLTIEKNSFFAHISKELFLCTKFILRRKLIRNYVFRIFDTLCCGAIFTINFSKKIFFTKIRLFLALKAKNITMKRTHSHYEFYSCHMTIENVFYNPDNLLLFQSDFGKNPTLASSGQKEKKITDFTVVFGKNDEKVDFRRRVSDRSTNFFGAIWAKFKSAIFFVCQISLLNGS